MWKENWWFSFGSSWLEQWQRWKSWFSSQRRVIPGELDFTFCQPAPPIMVPVSLSPIMSRLANKPACFVKPTTDEPTHFAKPTTDKDVEKAKLAAVPERTRKDTEWCYLTSIKDKELQMSSKHSTSLLWPTNGCELAVLFCTRSKEGGRTAIPSRHCQPYPPDTVHHIICSIMRHLCHQRKQLDIFQDMCFSEFRTVLDSEMKRLKAAGLASKGRQAEAFSPQEEDQL